MTRASTSRRSGLTLALALAACRPAGGDAEASPAAAAIDPPPATVAEPASARACTPTPVRPPAPAAAAGPVFVLVDRARVLRLDDAGVREVATLRAESSAWNSELVATANGELWLSDWDGVRVINDDGEARRIRPVTGDDHVDRLAIRGPADAWAVTGSIEWQVLHFDGRRWTRERGRGDFPGRYDDNKFVDLAVTDDGVWVSSWNGLWRGAGGVWEAIEIDASMPALWSFRGGLIAGDSDHPGLREGAGWRSLVWPRTGDIRRAVTDLGLVAAVDGPHVQIGSILGKGCVARSAALPGSHIDDLAIDGRGRVWVATDRALAVVEADGGVAALWPIGALEGLTGRIVRVAVVGAGPSRLPAPRAVATRTIVGRLRTYKDGRPLVGAALELCASATEGRCPAASRVASARSGADGGFRFERVPEGEYSLDVRPPAEVEACQGIFSVSGHAVATARACPPDPAIPCDLGELDDCLPFEMPPPPT